MSNGNYPSPNVAYQGVHALIGYAVVTTSAFKLHHWTWGFAVVVVFALIKEFIFDIFGNEHDSFLSSLEDFAFYMVGSVGGIVMAIVVPASR